MMKPAFLKIFTALAVIPVISFLAVDGLYKALSPPRSIPDYSEFVTVEPVSPPPRPGELRGAYEVISSRNLFGSVRTEEVVQEVAFDVDALEPTKLNLTLLGTVAGSNGSFDYAVIEERGKGNQALYREGDSISGARVMKIMRARVVLRVDGRDEVLSMEEPPRDEPAGRRVATPGARRPPEASAGEFITLERGRIEAAVQDLGRVMSDARIRPFFSGGQVEGFMVSSIAPGSIYQQLGLQNGDVIQGINGRRLENPNDLLELYNNLHSGMEMEVGIKRRGRDELLRYRITD